MIFILCQKTHVNLSFSDQLVIEKNIFKIFTQYKYVLKNDDNNNKKVSPIVAPSDPQGT
jgi:hypothetical protein